MSLAWGTGVSRFLAMPRSTAPVIVSELKHPRSSPSLAAVGTSLLREDAAHFAAGFMLWDDDWDMTELVMDQDPEHGRSIKGLLEIADDYFTAIAPDPTDTELAHARRVLLDLTASA